MEQKLISCGKRFPPLPANYPLLVAQNLSDNEDPIFYPIHDHTCCYRCRIPKLLGRRIRGCFHGWVILSDNIMWSLWNPMTSKIIHLPDLILEGGNSEFNGQCCLSSPPDDPGSILLLTRIARPSIVFCRLDCGRKGLSWTQMSYTRQLRRITGYYGGYLRCPTCYNGKVYALCGDARAFVIQVDFVVKDKSEVCIKLLLFGACPYPFYDRYPIFISYLKGSVKELFCIMVAFYEETKTFCKVYLFKWVMTRIRWEELEEIDLKDSLKTKMWERMVDLKDAILFIDLGRDNSIFYSDSIASEFGGYIHFRDDMGKLIYSYNVKDESISLSSMPSSVLPTSHVSLWECRLERDHGKGVCTLEENKDDKIVVRPVTDDEVELNESCLLNLPSHVLEMIVELCVGVEYMYFRATCKRCHLGAPLIQWSNKKVALRKLHKYSVVSPWLMFVDQKQSIITYTDPMFGDKYYMKRLQVSPWRDNIFCSRFGWILFYSDAFSYLVFFNPFTNDIRKLPDVPCALDTLSFSAPPTSPDCMVIGFRCWADPHAYIYFERSWRRMSMDFGRAHSYPYRFPTFYGQDLYALSNEGRLYVLKNLVKLQGFYWKQVVAAATSMGQNFLVKCDQHLLLVIVGGELGESVEVFKPNEYTKEWEKVDCLGRHMIYICDGTCLCIEAKIPEMENKIYFPRVHSRNGKILFYSLETCKYHMFNDKKIQECFGFNGTTHFQAHAWIQPNWS